MQQNVYVTQNNTNRGCMSGCGSVFAVALVIGLAVQYWYISAALVVIGVGAAVWYYRTQHNQGPAAPTPTAIRPAPAPALAGTCEQCGASTNGNFCANCGAAQTRTCTHCGARGLTSPYCPQCGAATYTPPTPT
ncbi:MAG TPA: hypothetical protein VFZ00_00170 [Solirubrobacter sp.]|nr:hypothetical protein [Solirubrobacter sp.]